MLKRETPDHQSVCGGAPLSRLTVERLIGCLLAEDAEARAELLTLALTDDDALAIWCSCEASRLGDQSLRTVPDLARWLEPRILDLLVGSLGRGRTFASDDRADESISSLSPACGSQDIAPKAEVLAEPQQLSNLAALAQRLARLRTLEQDFHRTLEQEKLEGLKELAYGAGHEINNPLANISVRAQTLLREETDPERRRKLAAINAQALRAHEMIADMMLFARPPVPALESFDLATFIEEALGDLRERAAQQRTEFSVECAQGPLQIEADRAQVAVAVRALCVNALEALARGGSLRVSVGAAEAILCGSPAVEIAVTDTGPGVPADVRPRIFDPFFSGREAGRGLGMGLCKAWTIARAHGGRLEVDSTVGATTFTLSLPRLPTSASR